MGKIETTTNQAQETVATPVQQVAPVRETTQPRTNRLLKVAVIGTGNCGCMMANDACNALNIDGIAINGSDRDLQLVNSPKIIPYLTGDGKGTGKNVEIAEDMFYDSTGMALDKKFINIIENNDVILISTSVGGGYGSGASVHLLDLLTALYEHKLFIIAGVLPFKDELGDAYRGACRWLDKVRKSNVGYILYQNGKFVGKRSSTGKIITPNEDAMMVNRQFVEDIMVMQGDFLARTYTGGIDERDMLTVLSAPGRMVIGSMEEMEPANVIERSLIKTIKHHIETATPHVEMANDKYINASAVMYALGEPFDEFKVDVRNDLQTEFGVHTKDTSNFSDEDKNTMAIVLTGLSEPSMVIDRVANRFLKLDDDLHQRKATTSKLDSISGKQGTMETVKAKQSFSDETDLATQGQKSKEEKLKEFMLSRAKR